MRPRGWLHWLRRAAPEAQPAGGLSGAVTSTIALLPYQLEPALAMRRDGVPRVMVADDVGLGKTVQAGLILNELAAEHEALRALIVVPAGLREQWARELATRFGLETTPASSPWLARAASELPSDVNPWRQPGIYVASSDFIKRPEVLRPMEDVIWDLVIVDEAHEATLGTARRAAVHAIASRGRRVVLLTATPHAGDRDQFNALCRIGSDASSPPIMMFRRSRADVGAHARRRTVLLPVRLSAHEHRMHRLLESYTSRLCLEARRRGDGPARLVAIVLRKRALSSAASLAASCTRRLALLDGGDDSAVETQLLLPLGDEEPLADREPDSILAAAGLADVERERQWLAAIAAAAHHAAWRESKIAFLVRLLRRIKEPAIVFTEYRDTLERLQRAIVRSHPDLQILHGGVDLRARTAAQNSFNAAGSLLLATDAASEGLNLHARCRAVIHYELPWSPARLEQRTGRVDRIGQSRTVHEILLVADDTAERLVLAPLVARVARSRSVLPRASGLVDVLTESRVAAAVIEGEPVQPEDVGLATGAFSEAPAHFRQEAIAEAARLSELRGWRAAASPRRMKERSDTEATCPAVTATALHARRGLVPGGLIAVYMLSLVASDGSVAHRELAVVHRPLPSAFLCRTPADVRRIVDQFIRFDDGGTRAALLDRSADRLELVSDRWVRASAAMGQREKTVVRSAPSAATQLVQAGLFDQRTVRAAAAQSRASALLLEESGHRMQSLASCARLAHSAQLRAVLVVTSAGPR